MNKKFQSLDYSRGWDDYWRDHPQGYSPQEQMINWSGQLNAMIDFFNEYFDVDLAEYATDVMEGWYFDGRLEEIINEALFNSKADKTTVNSLINDIAINVKMFGAVGDGVTDDTTAIKNLITELSLVANFENKPTLFFPSGLGFVTSETIIVPENINVVMEAPLLFNSLLPIPALVIGKEEAQIMNGHYKLQVHRVNQSEWGSENSIGIKMLNCFNCNIEIVSVRNFTIGCQMIGEGSGFAYNSIHLNELRDNKIGLDLTNGGVGGYINENLFLGGRFSVTTTTNTDKSRYGLRITSKGDYYNNNNNFYKPNFELRADTIGVANEAVGVLMEFSKGNFIHNMRNEKNTVGVRFLNDSEHNNITVGWGLNDFDTNYRPNTVERMDKNTIEKTSTQIFSISNLHEKTCLYNGSDYYNIKGVFINTSSNNTFSKRMGNVNILPNSINFPTTGAVGINIDTVDKKRFVVRRSLNKLSGLVGRIGLRCRDINGDVLTNTSEGHPHAAGASNADLTYNATHGGVYRLGSDTAIDVYFNVKDHVKSVDLLITGGTDCELNGFTVESLDGFTSVNTADNVNLATTPPTTGTWKKGTTLYNDEPIAGAYMGWICIDETTNTWKGFGLIET